MTDYNILNFLKFDTNGLWLLPGAYYIASVFVT